MYTKQTHGQCAARGEQRAGSGRQAWKEVNRHLVTFNLGKEEYGPLLPGARVSVRGVINLRGRCSPSLISESMLAACCRGKRCSADCGRGTRRKEARHGLGGYGVSQVIKIPWG